MTTTSSSLSFLTWRTSEPSHCRPAAPFRRAWSKFWPIRRRPRPPRGRGGRGGGPPGPGTGRVAAGGGGGGGPGSWWARRAGGGRAAGGGGRGGGGGGGEGAVPAGKRAWQDGQRTTASPTSS